MRPRTLLFCMIAGLGLLCIWLAVWMGMGDLALRAFFRRRK